MLAVQSLHFSVYSDVSQGKAANSHIWETATLKYFRLFALKKEIEIKHFTPGSFIHSY